jgi:radical SAM superfamily enzyme YgiQ (UPF0313 family)
MYNNKDDNDIIELPIIKIQPQIPFDVCLLGLNWYREKDPRLPLSSALIAAYVNEHLKFIKGKELHIINEDVRSNLSEVLHEIIEINPQILGIGVYVWNATAVKEVLNGLKILGFKGKIVLGGPEITYGNEMLKEEYPQADYFVRGDGEKAFTEIIKYEANEVSSLPTSVYTRNDSQFSDFAIVSYNEIVSPFLNPEYLHNLIGISEFGFTRWQTQRGCLYRCSFCAFPNGYNTFKEQDLEIIEKELRVFLDNNVKEVAVLDPIFFVNRDRALDILLLIEKICPQIRFEIQTKLEHLDEEIIQMISRLNIALECGVQTFDSLVQKKIKRVNKKERMIEIMELLKKKNIEFEAHLIFGLPYQTIESLRADYELLKKYTVDVKLFPLVLLKGTGLDIEIQSNNSEDFVFSSIFPREVISTKWMSSKDILDLKKGIYF